MILCVASEDDAASRNIAEKIMGRYHLERLAEPVGNCPMYRAFLSGREVRLVMTRGELVFEQSLADALSPELVVFLSRHESRSGRPILSTHVPGNLGDAEFGGVAGKVSIAPANVMRNVLRELAVQRERVGLLGFEVCYEGTHHGPSLDLPAVFVEIGSTPEEWGNPAAAEAVAEAVMEAVKCSSAVPVAVGMGGSHCNMRFTRLALEGEVAFGHIVPSYLFGVLDAEMLRRLVERTVEEVQMFILDWKGIDGKDREGLLGKLKEVPLEVRRVSDFRRGL